MKHSHQSSFITQQTRYSEQLFAKSINRVRKRINILSTSAVIDRDCPEVNVSMCGRQKGKGGSGLCAVMAKLSFQAELLQQDVRGEILQLRKTKQMISIVAEDLRRRSQRAEQQMRFEVKQLQQEIDQRRLTNLQRGRKLEKQCQKRRQNGDHLKQRLQQVTRRVSALQHSLGCYTGTDKLQKV